MEGLIEYLGCGKYSKRKDAGDFKVLSIADINKKKNSTIFYRVCSPRSKILKFF
jgi:hypothetical protein